MRRLILTSIPSVPHLEALMLLRASAPTPWSAPALAQRLYVTPAAAGAVLEYLCHAGMLNADADADASPRAYRLRPQRDRLLATLAQLYSTHLVEITRLIHDRPGTAR
ncbi:hypothetical protein F2P45_18905 [Massilia sp. CCM 8733]|uniref:MarR family transcriptional regulator n=1 Tax=Massilia mucilaginosa TaxID=2609282 RepID=A0ABX0NWG6_9BURK|nr:hypothetical protein [Massilia mucilaginosa]NHZ91070.1 hypothetical protein [Massilia mucilaginosa]